MDHSKEKQLRSTSAPSVIYFLAAGDPAAAIKIGVTTRSTLLDRMKKTQVHNHSPSNCSESFVSMTVTARRGTRRIRRTRCACASPTSAVSSPTRAEPIGSRPRRSCSRKSPRPRFLPKTSASRNPSIRRSIPTRPPDLRRNRATYALLVFAVMAAYVSLWRSHWLPLTPFISKYGGDALWALLVFSRLRFHLQERLDHPDRARRARVFMDHRVLAALSRSMDRRHPRDSSGSARPRFHLQPSGPPRLRPGHRSRNAG